MGRLGRRQQVTPTRNNTPACCKCTKGKCKMKTSCQCAAEDTQCTNCASENCERSGDGHQHQKQQPKEQEQKQQQLSDMEFKYEERWDPENPMQTLTAIWRRLRRLEEQVETLAKENTEMKKERQKDREQIVDLQTKLKGKDVMGEMRDQAMGGVGKGEDKRTEHTRKRQTGRSRAGSVIGLDGKELTGDWDRKREGQEWKKELERKKNIIFQGYRGDVTGDKIKTDIKEKMGIEMNIKKISIRRPRGGGDLSPRCWSSKPLSK